jgi:hypothetical protein
MEGQVGNSLAFSVFSPHTRDIVSLAWAQGSGRHARILCIVVHSPTLAERRLRHKRPFSNTTQKTTKLMRRIFADTHAPTRRTGNEQDR